MVDGRNRSTVVEQTATPILEIGRTWMLDDRTVARSAELGLDGPFGFWTLGRAGVLGDVDADLAAAAIGFMAPKRVRHFWESRPAGTDPRAVTDEYANAGATWAREALADVSSARLERLVDLSRRVIGEAQPSTGMLFAGWRLVGVPSDPSGATAVVLNTLRELRGGAHLSAVHAVGLGPLGAIMSTEDPVRGGESWASTFGWEAPLPARDPVRRRDAEEMTTMICRGAYSCLSADEGNEFVDLVSEVRSTFG